MAKDVFGNPIPYTDKFNGLKPSAPKDVPPPTPKTNNHGGNSSWWPKPQQK